LSNAQNWRVNENNATVMCVLSSLAKLANNPPNNESFYLQRIKITLLVFTAAGLHEFKTMVVG